MKKMCYLLSVMMSCIMQPVYADAVCVDDGDTLRCGAGTLESIDYKGDVILEGTTVLNNVKTIGDLTANNAMLNHVNTVGDVNLQNVTISGNVSFVGDAHVRHSRLESTVKIVGDTDFDASECRSDLMLVGDVIATNSLFRGSITISTYSSQFSHSMLNTLNIKKQSRDIKQTIYLKDSSTANTIHFQGNKGVVELSAGSSVKGQVTGGTVVEQ